MAVDGHGGVSRHHSTGPGRAELLSAGRQTGGFGGRVEPREGMTDQLSLFGERVWCAPWEAERPEADLRPQGSGKRRRRRRGIEPWR